MAEASLERLDLIEKLRSHHSELADLAKRHAAEEPRSAREWSALQQLEHHLLAEDIWARAARRAAFEDEPDLAELWATYRRVEEQNPFPPPAETRSLDGLLRALEARHQETLALVEAIPDSAFERRGRNTGFGNLNVLQMLRAIYRHAGMHIDQIQGSEPSFQPRQVS
jgi:hypothetical protein